MRIFTVKNLIIKNNTMKVKHRLTQIAKPANYSGLFVTSTPLILYKTTKKTTEERIVKKAEEAASNTKPNNTEWREKQSRKTLENAGISRESEQNKYLNSDGTIKKDEFKKVLNNDSKNNPTNSVPHKGSPENNDNHLDSSEYESTSDTTTETSFFENMKESVKEKFNNIKEKFTTTFRGHSSPTEKLTMDEWLDKNADKETLNIDDLMSLDTSLPPSLQAILDAPPLEEAEGFLTTIRDYVSDGDPDDLFEKMKNMVEEIDSIL